MAKQLLEINKFQNGTITTPDATDTPEQSATFSINLDCVNKDGALQGAPINAAVTIRNSDTTADATPDIDKARVIRTLSDDDTVREDVVYFEEANDRLHFISNLEKANTDTRVDHVDISAVFPSDGKEFNDVSLKDVAMESHNKEVHIGLGKLNNPQWVGYTNHKGLKKSAKTLVAGDAEVKYPSDLPYMDKIVLGSTSDSYFYGIEVGGTRIWKIDGSADATNAGKRVASSTRGTFTNLISIASDPANGRLYVLDKQSDGYVYEVSVDNLDEKDVTYTLPATYPGPANSWYSDVQFTSGGSGKIWLAAHWFSRSVTSGGSTAQFIWNFAYSASSNNAVPVNKMPRMTGGSTATPGTWVRFEDASGYGTFVASEVIVSSTYIAETFPISLLKHPTDNDAVYWFARYPNHSSNGNTQWLNRWLTRDVSDMSGSTLLDQVDSISAVRTLCMHRVKHDHSATAVDFMPIHNVYHPNDAWENNNIFSAVNVDSVGTDNDGTEIYLTIGDVLQRFTGVFLTSWTALETSSPYNKHNFVFESADGPSVSTEYTVTPPGQSPRTGVSINFGYVPSTASVATGNYVAETTNIVLARQTGTGGFDKIAQAFSQGTDATFYRDHSLLGFTTTNSGSSETGDLEDGFTYFYKTTIIYDGYQESPLSLETSMDSDHTDTRDNSVTITVNDYTQVPDRCSAVKVYRAENPSSAAKTPTSVYRLIKVIPFSKAWAINGVSRVFTFDDGGIKGASYEAESGLAETLESTLPRYALSAQLNNQHYIGKCWHDGYVDDATSYIFVSKVGKFDVFDWLVDFIKLPTMPTALTSFSGRIYAFDELNTYRIRGGNELFIEDVFEGVGCLNDDAVVSTDFGMFFADNKNIYQHNGQSAEPIGEAIVRGDSTYSWQNRDTTYHTRAMYDATRRSVYFTFKVSGANKYYAWSWNIPRKRWDMLSFGNNDTIGTNVSEQGDHEPKGFYVLNDTSLNIGYKNIGGDSAGSGQQSANSTYVTNFLGGATKRLWTWVSKDLTMGNDTQEKKLKQILISGDQLKANYSVPASSAFNSALPAVGSQVSATKKRGTYRMDILSSDKTSTNLRLRLDANTAGDECGAVGVLFRTKKSPR